MEIRHRRAPLSPLMFTSASEQSDQSTSPHLASPSPHLALPPIASPASPCTHIGSPQLASTPNIFPDFKYITTSEGFSSQRPSIVENLNNLTQKAKLVGRKGTKRKALVYEGPLECNTMDSGVNISLNISNNFSEEEEKIIRHQGIF